MEKDLFFCALSDRIICYKKWEAIATMGGLLERDTMGYLLEACREVRTTVAADSSKSSLVK